MDQEGSGDQFSSLSSSTTSNTQKKGQKRNREEFEEEKNSEKCKRQKLTQHTPLSVTNEGDAKSEPSSIFGPQPKPVTSHKKKEN